MSWHIVSPAAEQVEMSNSHAEASYCVGDWVIKGSSCCQASNSVAGIARPLYERTIRILVVKKVHYIAGFEIKILSRSELTRATRSCSNSSTSTLSPWRRRSTSWRAWNRQVDFDIVSNLSNVKISIWSFVGMCMHSIRMWGYEDVRNVSLCLS